MTTSHTLSQLLSPYRTISIIGMAKNVGKTTTLNHLIRAFRKEEQTIALTSIGRDGERVDVVTKTEKPPIFVFKNTIVATTEKLLPLCDITKEIMLVTDINTPLGRVVLVRALSDGFVQLGGPSMTTQLSDLLKHIPGDKVLVDGAISRKTLAGITDATVLCTGASLSPSMHKTIEETRHGVNMLMIPKLVPPGVNPHPLGACVRQAALNDASVLKYLPGAVTDSMVHDLVRPNMDGGTIVAEDPSKLFITPATYEKLRIKKIKLAVLNPIRLVGLTVNPFSPYHTDFNPKEFLQKMQEAVPIPVFDLKIQE